MGIPMIILHTKTKQIFLCRGSDIYDTELLHLFKLAKQHSWDLDKVEVPDIRKLATNSDLDWRDNLIASGYDVIN